MLVQNTLKLIKLIQEGGSIATKTNHWKLSDAAHVMYDIYDNPKVDYFTVKYTDLQKALSYIDNTIADGIDNYPEFMNPEYNKNFWDDFKDFIIMAIKNKQNIVVSS